MGVLVILWTYILCSYDNSLQGSCTQVSHEEGGLL